MKLYYDARDEAICERRGDRRLYWLDDIGAVPFAEAHAHEAGFLFAGARPMEDYHRLVRGHPNVRDRPEERAPLLRLDQVLDTLAAARVDVPAPRTWRLAVDAPVPSDLAYPLFLRTPASSWKLGGRVSRVATPRQLAEESEALRRGFGWDQVVLARAWLDLAAAGEAPHGPVPQEVRVWLVDRVPVAWSFHHLHVVTKPRGFPLERPDVDRLRELAARVGSAFTSRLVVADFARDVSGGWWFIEAGPGSCAGTAHEAVFKHVASRLLGQPTGLEEDVIGGGL